MKLNQQQAQHLLFRAGFGGTFQEVQQVMKRPKKKVVAEILDRSKKYIPIEIVKKPDADRRLRDMSKEEKERMAKDLRRQSLELNTTWIKEMVKSKGFLREKMALFWHDHFACKARQPYLAQLQLNTIRKHALGKFSELLFAVSKDPAMLQFLNNQQNRKRSPNENFAREVMELFTLGRGHYSEEDIKEAARAFTGWGFNREGDFVFRERVHDEGQKTFLGKTGAFDGDDILNIILEQKQTARFIITKIFRYFVNDQPDSAHIENLIEPFYLSDYDIGWLMEQIFASNWFYRPENIGNQIKSPVEYLVQLERMLGIEFENPDMEVFIQKALGQVLLQPPNVAGWPGGRSWIDSSTLLFRLRIPDLIFSAAELPFETQEPGDVNDPLGKMKKFRNLKATVRWEEFIGQFDGLREAEKEQVLINYLLQTNPPPNLPYNLPEAPAKRLVSITQQLIKTPEFQLS